MLSSFELFVLNLLATLAPYLIVTMSINLEYGYAGVPNLERRWLWQEAPSWPESFLAGYCVYVGDRAEPGLHQRQYTHSK